MPKIISLLKYKLGRLGPGFITGAADNDPAGIATYTIAGAQFGYKFNWLTIFLIPMMVAIQEMCGRIGMVSGMGIAGAIRRYYSKKLLYFAVFLLFIANTINIGADLGAMAASMQMVLGFPFMFWLILVTLITVILEIFVSYDQYSQFLKWLALTLFVYGITAVITKQDWLEVLRYTIIPHFELNPLFIMTFVGFLGTTISPYLFFWQASEEVEEAIKDGKIKHFEEIPHVLQHEIRHMRKDTTVGMIFANTIFFFILLTSTATFHKNGITDIGSLSEAALALKPLAGDFAFILFALGIIGIGLQAVPILAGSAAYAFSEAFGFKEGLAKKFTEAKAFYIIIAISTLAGALMNLVGVNAIKALYYSAVINGIIAVPLIAVIIRIADDKRVVGRFTSSKISKVFAWSAFGLMGFASVLLITQFFSTLLIGS